MLEDAPEYESTLLSTTNCLVTDANLVTDVQAQSAENFKKLEDPVIDLKPRHVMIVRSRPATRQPSLERARIPELLGWHHLHRDSSGRRRGVRRESPRGGGEQRRVRGGPGLEDGGEATHH